MITAHIFAGAFERSRSTVAAAIFSMLLGGTLIFGMGFAKADLLHNAGHDWRHSMNFPCH